MSTESYVKLRKLTKQDGSLMSMGQTPAWVPDPARCRMIFFPRSTLPRSIIAPLRYASTGEYDPSTMAWARRRLTNRQRRILYARWYC